MNVSAAPIDLFSYDDRSLGDEGGILRQSLDDAVLPPSRDRGDEIVERLIGALQDAAVTDGILINPSVFSRTLAFLDVLPRDVPLPRIVVESEREVGLDWDEGSDRVVSVTVGVAPSGVGFSALFGREPMFGRLEIAQGTPDTLRFLLARLYPKKRFKI